MDGCWKICWSSHGIAHVSSWLKQLCISQGQVRDGTGVWKPLKIEGGAVLLDGGQLHLDENGFLYRGGKNKSTVVVYRRDGEHCRTHSPRNPVAPRIQREVAL